MSDVAEVSTGGTQEDQSEALNVDTQPSLLKKGGLFGKSMAMSPRVGDGTPSPAEKSGDGATNGNEAAVSSQSSKNGNGDADADANANGDHKDDSESNHDEEMIVDEPQEEQPVEPAEEEEEEKSAPAEEDADESAGDEPAAPEPAAAEEESQEEEEKAEDVIEDIEMEDADEQPEEAAKEEEEAAPAVADTAETEDAGETAADEEEKDESMEEEKEEAKEEPAQPKADETPAPADEKKEEEVEEECVKKVISMDTDKTGESSEAKEEETKPEEAAEKAEEEPALSTPTKRGRGRPPKSASSTPLAAKKTPSVKKTPVAAAADDAHDDEDAAAAPAADEAEKEEETEETPASSSKRAPRGAAKRANEALASPAAPTPAKGRGRRSIKSDTSSQVDTEEEKKAEEGEEKKEEAAEEEEKEEAKTPAGRGRRVTKATPASAPRTSGRGKKPAAVEEKEEGDEEEGEKEEEAEKKEEEEEMPTPRRGRAAKSAQATPATAKKATPARSAKSAKKAADEEGEGEKKEEEEATSVSPSRRSTRGSPTKTPTQQPAAATPKSRGRRASMKSETTTTTEEAEKAEEGEEEEEQAATSSAKRGRGRGRKSAAKTPTAASAKKTKKKGGEDDEDPFDMDTELDKHPEPLRNITVEKGSFGEMKYTRSPAAATTSAKGKYAGTEKSALDKVGNLPNTPAATGTPKTIASVQSSRKSLGGSPSKRTPTSRRNKKEVGSETGEETEEDDPMEGGEEDAAMDTTPVEKKGRGGRPSGGASVGRKRKAEETLTPSAVKRAAVSVTIPELDADKQWAADHPEDDSAPLVPGARVFAVFQKVFYPALVGERDGLGRYLVEFVEDKIVRPVPPAGVVPLSAVTIDKEVLYQSSPDADPIACRVLKSANAANAKEWQEGAFKLMQADNEVEHDAKWSTLQLEVHARDWKQYVNAKSKMVTKINTDNITSLEDRRERRSRVHNDTAVAIATLRGTPEPTGRRSITRKTPAAAATAKTPAKMTPTTGRRGRKPKAAAAAADDDDEKEAGEEKEGGAEGGETEKSKKADAAAEKKADASEKEDEKDTRIFLNKTFILTSANRTTSDVVFKKNEMKKQILERGGKVVEDINQVALDAEAYLISDTHYRTHKYLAAMSRGMPCLSHMWLVQCVTKEQFAPYDEFKLAGGQGLLNGELYPLPDVRGKLLVGKSIMVHSKTDASMKRGTMGFKQIWSPIVELLGAKVKPDTVLTDLGDDFDALVVPADFEILLTDSSCPPEVVQKLEAAGKAVVSSEWLIQSIIMGACPAFDAHPRFRYDSGNEPAASQPPRGSQDQQTSQSQS